MTIFDLIHSDPESPILILRDKIQKGALEVDAQGDQKYSDGCLDAFDDLFEEMSNTYIPAEVVQKLVDALKVVKSNGEGRGMGWTPAQHARLTIAEFIEWLEEHV